MHYTFLLRKLTQQPSSAISEEGIIKYSRSVSLYSVVFLFNTSIHSYLPCDWFSQHGSKLQLSDGMVRRDAS